MFLHSSKRTGRAIVLEIDAIDIEYSESLYTVDKQLASIDCNECASDVFIRIAHIFRTLRI